MFYANNPALVEGLSRNVLAADISSSWLFDKAQPA